MQEQRAFYSIRRVFIEPGSVYRGSTSNSPDRSGEVSFLVVGKHRQDGVVAGRELVGVDPSDEADDAVLRVREG